MRSLAGVAAVVVLGLTVAGCGGDDEQQPAAERSPVVKQQSSAEQSPAQRSARVLTGTAERLTGGSDSLSRYRGDVVLIVNTASQCGFTPQFAELQELYAARESRGLTILGFPSDSFNQELDDAKAIKDVCEKNFGVKFPMFAKTSVTGDDAHPLFKRLAAVVGEEPKWNFNKYLVDRRGRVVGRFDSGEIPVEEIDRLLAATKA